MVLLYSTGNYTQYFVTTYKGNWFQIGEVVHQGCILSPCLFNLYAEYIMRIAGLDEARAGIKIAGRNINASELSCLYSPALTSIHDNWKSHSFD